MSKPQAQTIVTGPVYVFDCHMSDDGVELPQGRKQSPKKTRKQRQAVRKNHGNKRPRGKGRQD
jgi:hypothetical protein